MDHLIKIAKKRGLKVMSGTIFSSNVGMLALAKDLGFSIETDKDDPHTQIASKLLSN